MTRFKLPFSDVNSIIELTSDRISLPSNIVYASGDTRQDKYNDATRILDTQSHVNAVVILEPTREGLYNAINELNTFSAGKRLRTQHNQPTQATDANVFQSLTNYLSRRNSQHQNPLLDGVDIATLTSATTALWDKSIKDTLNTEKATLQQSIITYAPFYSGDRSKPGSYINTHIDAANSDSDLRIIECMKGSGTLLFDDNDFKIHDNKGVEIIHSGITCWALAEGSSVAIRMPSPKNDGMGAKPTVHAHGIGSADDTPEERLTVRHDLILG